MVGSKSLTNIGGVPEKIQGVVKQFGYHYGTSSKGNKRQSTNFDDPELETLLNDYPG